MTRLRQQLIQELVLRGMSARTQEAYIHQVYHLAKHYRQSPDQLTDAQVRAYLFYLAQERKLSASTINQAVNAFRFLYDKVLHRDVEALRRALPHPRKEIRRPQVFSLEELGALFVRGCPHLKHRAFLMTVYGAGLRLNEACHLKIEDLDSARSQIRVVQGKGRKDRYTLFPAPLQEELQGYRRVFEPRHWLFPACRNAQEPMIDGTAQRIFNHAVAVAGLPRKGGIHSLRHSFATHLVEAGVEMPVVQQLMGHANLSTTMGYMHVRQQRLAQIQSPLTLLNLSGLIRFW
jgi:site-specific recombinase XerD